METDGIEDDYFEGKGCKCFARSESECGCDVDWTPREVYRLLKENDKLQETIAQLQDTIDGEISRLKTCAAFIR